MPILNGARFLGKFRPLFSLVLLSSSRFTSSQLRQQFATGLDKLLVALRFRGRRKALLIGVQEIRRTEGGPDDNENESEVMNEYYMELGSCPRGGHGRRIKRSKKIINAEILKGPHRDVEVMKQLLVEKYSYRLQDITVLVDDNHADHPQPTLLNITRQIKTLVKDARRGDRFFFHFAGHADQEDTDDPDEDDGKNEFIFTSDGFKIVDNDLKVLLVDPLPIGSRLTAIMDCCHSCTLLDLPHHRCNRVYVPWLSKGTRNSKSRREDLGRKDGVPGESIPKTPSNGSRQNSDTVPLVRTTIRNSAMSKPSRPSVIATQNSAPRKALIALQKRLNVLIPGQDSIPPAKSSILTSPEALQFESPIDATKCSGFCKDRPLLETEMNKAQVICLSASKDGQMSWEDAKGDSMTQYLVKTLTANPHPTLGRLLRIVSHDIHNFYVTHLHDMARKHRRKMRDYHGKKKAGKKRAGKSDEADDVPPIKPEMHNFQDPQLSSHAPVDMKAQFDP